MMNYSQNNVKQSIKHAYYSMMRTTAKSIKHKLWTNYISKQNYP